MRIVHEIEGHAQVGGQVRPYAPTKVGGKAGGNCELIIAVLGPVLRTAGGDEVQTDGEAFFIEGDADDVIDMLQSALRMLRVSAGPDFVFKRAHEGFPQPMSPEDMCECGHDRGNHFMGGANPMTGVQCVECGHDEGDDRRCREFTPERRKGLDHG